jgi:transposase
VKDGWPLRRAAERFQVSHTTAARWASRYRQHGEADTAPETAQQSEQAPLQKAFFRLVTFPAREFREKY